MSESAQTQLRKALERWLDAADRWGPYHRNTRKVQAQYEEVKRRLDPADQRFADGTLKADSPPPAPSFARLSCGCPIDSGCTGEHGL